MDQDSRADDRGRPGTAGRMARLTGLALVVALLGSGTGLLVGQLAAGSADEPAQAPADAAAAAPDRSVVLLTGGTVDVGPATLTALEATGTTAEQPGSGFLRGRPPLGQKVTQYLPDPDLDLVVVQGGEVDAASAVEPRGVEVGALHLIDRVRAGAGPRTAVVLVGPVPESETPPARLIEVRDQLRTAAAQRGLPFLDPVALGWRTTDDDLSERFAQAVLPFVPTQP